MTGIYDGFHMFDDTFGYMVIVEYNGRIGICTDGIRANPDDLSDKTIKAIEVHFFNQPLRHGLKFAKAVEVLNIPQSQLKRVGAVRATGVIYESEVLVDLP